MVKRLRQTLDGEGRLKFGTAVYPEDGKEAAALFQCATARLAQGLGLLDPDATPRQAGI
jgi:hypothetical protein